MSNSIIKTVLDEIFIATEIDPAVIFPDDNLSSDLGLKPSQALQILQKSAEKLHISCHLDIDQCPETPRAMVEFLSQSLEVNDAA